MDTEETTSVEGYSCDCKGFHSLMVRDMCLRCLTAYAEGVQQVLKDEPNKLRIQMQHVAAALRAHLDGDPMTIRQALDAVPDGPEKAILRGR